MFSLETEELKNGHPRTGLANPFAQDLVNQHLVVLTDSEIRQAIALMRDANISSSERQQAHDKVQSSMLRLIPFAIERYGLPRIPAIELVGEVYETIARCMEDFDLEYKPKNPESENVAKFSTFTLKAISNTLKKPRHYVSPSIHVKVPDNAFSFLSIMLRSWEEYAQSHSSQPDSSSWFQATGDYLEVHDYASSTQAKFKRETFDGLIAQVLDQQYEFLDMPVKSDQMDPDTLEPITEEVADIVADPDVDIEHEGTARLVSSSVRAILLKELDPPQARVLGMRFAIITKRPFTYKEIGQVIGASRETARKIGVSAIEKLKNSAELAELF